MTEDVRMRLLDFPRWRVHTLAIRDREHPDAVYGPHGWTCPKCGALEDLPGELTREPTEATHG